MANLNSTIINGNLEVNGNLISKNKILLDLFYPIGSIYMSTERNEDTKTTIGKYGCKLADSLGGTWEKITDNFLLGANSNNVVTGTTSYGSSAYSISANQLPKHRHSVITKGTISGKCNISVLITNNHAFEFNINKITNWGVKGHGHTLDLPPKNVVEANQTLDNNERYIALYGGTNYKTPYIFPGTGHSHTITLSGTVSYSHKHNFTLYGANANGSITGKAGTTESSGSGNPINIMNPYYAVYMWRRIA